MLNKPNLKVACIQTDLIWENKQANVRLFQAHLDSIQNVDVIVLPEMWSTGFSMQCKSFAEENAHFELTQMQAWAKSKQAVIVGSSMCKSTAGFTNRLFWVEPSGEYQFYDKFHLFTFGKEDATYTAGKVPFIEVQYKSWVFRLQICYDLRFPESARNTTQYDVLVYVANWPERRSVHWSSLLIARAIENQAFVIGLNRIGLDGNAIQHSGNSVVLSPLGNTLVSAAFQNTVLYAELNAHDLAIRTQFPALDDIK